MNNRTLLAGVTALTLASMTFAPWAMAADDTPPGQGMVIYMQMGGNPGDGATLARGIRATTRSPAWSSRRCRKASWSPTGIRR